MLCVYDETDISEYDSVGMNSYLQADKLVAKLHRTLTLVASKRYITMMVETKGI